MKVENHYVYILRCVDETYYTGYTVDVKRRLEAHESGNGAKYTRGRGPLSLVYEESFPSKSSVLQREYQIKQLSRKQKEQLINEGSGKVHEYSREFSEREEG